ncbi:MAG: hypothetical protein AB7I13_02150 [Vicinamibacterales bacterium]
MSMMSLTHLMRLMPLARLRLLMPATPSRHTALACVLAATALFGACGNDNTPTTPTDTTPQTTTEVFTGTLTPGFTGFYSFAVVNSGTAAITLGSLIDTATGRPIETSVELGLGLPRREECEASSTTNATPGLTAQLSAALAPGIYCVRIADIGNVRTAASFGVRIVHP